MDMSEWWESLQATLSETLPSILGALAILVAGWLLAVVIRALIKKGLGLLKLNDRVHEGTGNKIDIEGGVAKGVFYLVLVLVLIAFFNVLDLPLVSEPLQTLVSQFVYYLPNLIAGAVLILVAWIIATVLRKIVTKALEATTLDEKIAVEAGMQPMSKSVGNVLYGVVILLFLPAVLDAFGIQGLLGPIQNMVDKILGMLPNILAALILGAVGWYLAKLLRNLVTNLLAAAGADKLGERAGFRGGMTLSKLIGLVVFVFIFVPALIAALGALKLETISRPATDMLGTMMAAVPDIFAAAVILAVAFFLSEFIASVAETLLAGLGFDRVPEKLGLGAVFSGETLASRVVGKVLVFFVMLFATVEAASVLGFTQISEIVSMLIKFGGQVLLGMVIISVGLWLSNLAHGAISRLERPNARLVAGMARFTILGLVFAMGLRSMGIADDIVNLAFGFTIGAVAVAVALSFGLGGREAAGKQMEHWLSRLREDR